MIYAKLSRVYRRGPHPPPPGYATRPGSALPRASRVASARRPSPGDLRHSGYRSGLRPLLLTPRFPRRASRADISRATRRGLALSLAYMASPADLRPPRGLRADARGPTPVGSFFLMRIKIVALIIIICGVLIIFALIRSI